jgi:hypothetical protein
MKNWKSICISHDISSIEFQFNQEFQFISLQFINFKTRGFLSSYFEREGVLFVNQTWPVGIHSIHRHVLVCSYGVDTDTSCLSTITDCLNCDTTHRHIRSTEQLTFNTHRRNNGLSEPALYRWTVASGGRKIEKRMLERRKREVWELGLERCGFLFLLSCAKFRVEKIEKVNLHHSFNQMVVCCLTVWLHYFCDCWESHPLLFPFEGYDSLMVGNGVYPLFEGDVSYVLVVSLVSLLGSFFFNGTLLISILMFRF